jgi:hypothetical protein
MVACAASRRVPRLEHAGVDHGSRQQKAGIMIKIRFLIPTAGITALGLALSSCGSSSPAAGSSPPAASKGGTTVTGCPADVVAWGSNQGIADLANVSGTLATVTRDIANGYDVQGSDNLPQDSMPLANAVSQALADPPMPADAGVAVTNYDNALQMIQAADTAVNGGDTATAVSDYATAKAQLDATYNALPGCPFVNPG